MAIGSSWQAHLLSCASGGSTMSKDCGHHCVSGRLSRRGLLGLSAAGVAGAALPAFARTGAGHPGRSRRLLFRNGTVLSMDPNIGDFQRADVLVKDGKIEAVGPNLSAWGAAVVDATGKIIMPG